jgi:hypothetical protein
MRRFTSVERRQHVRVPAHGSVVFWARGHLVHGRLTTISDVGLEITCHLGFALLGMGDTLIELGLRLDGPVGGWLQLRGRISHVRAASHMLVIAIDDLAPEFLPRIAAWSLAGHDVPAPPEVMIIDSDRDRRAATAAAFRWKGCQVIEVATPLEALQQFDGGGPDLDLIEVAQTTPPGIGDELRDYLESAHTEALVVRISGQRSPLGASRSRATTALRARVHASLGELHSRAARRVGSPASTERRV